MPITRLLLCSVLSFLPLVTSAAPNTTTTYETTPLSAEPDPFLTQKGVEGMTMPPRHTLLLAVGYGGGSYTDDNDWMNGTQVVVRYAPIPHGEIAWDAQVEFLNDNILGFSGGYRWYCCPGDKFEPYARVSAGTYVDGSSELAGFIDLARWRAKGALGLGQNFTTEAGVGYALNGFDMYIQTGYVFRFQ